MANVTIIPTRMELTRLKKKLKTLLKMPTLEKTICFVLFQAQQNL